MWQSCACQAIQQVTDRPMRAILLPNDDLIRMRVTYPNFVITARQRSNLVCLLFNGFLRRHRLPSGSHRTGFEGQSQKFRARLIKGLILDLSLGIADVSHHGAGVEQVVLAQRCELSDSAHSPEE